jgi:hypothetical protein
MLARIVIADAAGGTLEIAFSQCVLHSSRVSTPLAKGTTYSTAHLLMLAIGYGETLVLIVKRG